MIPSLRFHGLTIQNENNYWGQRDDIPPIYKHFNAYAGNGADYLISTLGMYGIHFYVSIPHPKDHGPEFHIAVINDNNQSIGKTTTDHYTDKQSVIFWLNAAIAEGIRVLHQKTLNNATANVEKASKMVK